MIGDFSQPVVVWGIEACTVSLGSCYIYIGTVLLPLIDAVKMAASRGSFFSSRRLASRAGRVWRRVGPLRIF